MKTDQVEIYYYRTFEYNLARFLTVMEGELRAMGATMVQVSPFKNKLHSPKPRYICNLDVSQRINRFSQYSAIILPYCGDEIRDLLQVDNAPQCVTHLTRSTSFLVRTVTPSCSAPSTCSVIERCRSKIDRSGTPIARMQTAW